MTGHCVRLSSYICKLAFDASHGFLRSVGHSASFLACPMFVLL